MNAVEFGARQAVVTCLKVKKGEQVVVITDRETEKYGDAIIKAAQDESAKVQKFCMEDFGERPSDGANPLRFPKQIADALSKTQVSFYIAQGKEGEYKSFRLPMVELIKKYNIRHGHMIGFSGVMMEQGMAVDYNKVREISKKVYDVVSSARNIRVTSPAGTDVIVSFDGSCRWIVDDGDIKPGTWANLPGGEVFSAPTSADGTIVVDGCLGDFFLGKYGSIEKTPLSYELKGGRCVEGSIRCSNKELEQEFVKYTFETDENSNRIGELGIGTNIGIKSLIGNLLQDEKFPGAHIALGDAFPALTGASWTSSAHNDGVMRNVTIVVDGKTIMQDGKFTL